MTFTTLSRRRTVGTLTFLSFSGLCAAALTPAQAQAALTTIASFNGTNGNDPYGGVTFDSQGNLFGTTVQDGASNNGMVYEIAKGSTTVTTIASFDVTNGKGPEAGVTFDSSGNLFGTTVAGGANGDGTVYEIAKGSTTIIDLASFDGTNGKTPYLGFVTLDSSDNLFGTTFGGGVNGVGTVYEVAEGSTSITTIASFNGTNGTEPLAGVTFDSTGNLFGTTSQGGANSDGTVFEITKGSTTITTIATFNGTNGIQPVAAVTFDSQGNLFGTTANGGANSVGTVYEIAKGSTTLTTLASFNNIDGAYPDGVTLDSQGNLFGTTNAGGTNNKGTVFEVTKGSTAIGNLASFNGTNGSSPLAAVTFDNQGNLFGTTAQGGMNNDGTVFEIAGASSPAAVPEASTTVSLGLLLTMGLGGIAYARRKRTQNAAPAA